MATPECGWLAASTCYSLCYSLDNIPAYLLVYCLFKLFIIEDSSHLTITVTSPVWDGHLYLRLTYIRPVIHYYIDSLVLSSTWLAPPLYA